MLNALGAQRRGGMGPQQLRYCPAQSLSLASVVTQALLKPLQLVLTLTWTSVQHSQYILETSARVLSDTENQPGQRVLGQMLTSPILRKCKSNHSETPPHTCENGQEHKCC